MYVHHVFFENLRVLGASEKLRRWNYLLKFSFFDFQILCLLIVVEYNLHKPGLYTYGKV
jgi:hypothetical protein